MRGFSAVSKPQGNQLAKFRVWSLENKISKKDVLHFLKKKDSVTPLDPPPSVAKIPEI